LDGTRRVILNLAQHYSPRRLMMLIGVCLAVCITWVMLSYLTGRDDLAADKKPGSAIELTIAGGRFVIPANLIRFADQKHDGLAERVDLALLWPTLSGRDADTSKKFVDPNGASNVIHLSITADAATVDSTGRLATVYARYFTGPAQPAPAGLVARKLVAGSAFEGEIVYFESGATQPFVARCYPRQPLLPPTCIRDVNIGGVLTYQYRFHQDLLADWQALNASIRSLVGDFRTP